MRNRIGLLIITTLVLCIGYGCDKESPDSIVTEETGNNFFNLEEGQKFRYALFLGESYQDDANCSFGYTGDTLELQVVEKEGDSYWVSERIITSSTMSKETYERYWPSADKELVNQWEVRSDTLFIGPDADYITSHLFPNGQERLPLAEFRGDQVEVVCWSTTPEAYAVDTDLMTINYTLLGKEYDRLNITVRNEIMQVDGNGSTSFYSMKDGIVSTSTVSAWTATGHGWHRIQ